MDTVFDRNEGVLSSTDSKDLEIVSNWINSEMEILSATNEGLVPSGHYSL